MTKLKELAQEYTNREYGKVVSVEKLLFKEQAKIDFKAGYLAAMESQKEDLKEAFDAGQDFEHNFTEQGVIPEFPDFEDWYNHKFKK